VSQLSAQSRSRRNAESRHKLGLYPDGDAGDLHQEEQNIKSTLALKSNKKSNFNDSNEMPGD